MDIYCGNLDCEKTLPCAAHASVVSYCKNESCDQVQPCSLHREQGEKLFRQLSALFASDPDIDEFGLVLDTNASVYQAATTTTATINSLQQPEGGSFMLIEHKLGVTYACVPILLRYVIKRFRELLFRTIFENNNDKDQQISLKSELLELTRVMLLVNADNYTAWNVRKKILFPPSSSSTLTTTATTTHILSGGATTTIISESDLQQELKFLDLLFSKHPKCGEAWAHRRWVLDRALSLKTGCWSRLRETQEGSSSSSSSSGSGSNSRDEKKILTFQEKWLQRELNVCIRSSELYPKNYYAWTHRHWVVSKLSLSKDILAALTKSRKWTDINVGDYCGFNHRQVLLTNFSQSASSLLIHHVNSFSHLASSTAIISNEIEAKNEKHNFSRTAATAAAATATTTTATTTTLTPVSSCTVCEVWTTEFEYVSKLQEFYTGHETLWLHRRFLVKSFHEMLCAHHTMSDSIDFLQSEIMFTKSMINNDQVEKYDDNKRFAASYGLWLTFLPLFNSNQNIDTIDNKNNNNPSTAVTLVREMSEWRKSLAELLPTIWGTATPMWPLLADIAATRSSASSSLSSSQSLM